MIVRLRQQFHTGWRLLSSKIEFRSSLCLHDLSVKLKRIDSIQKLTLVVFWLLSLQFLSTSLLVAQSDVPDLPEIPFDYVTYAVTNLPEHYLPSAPFGDAGFANNTPTDNLVTNAGATLGRVLFYDRRLSINNSVSCASCHTQETGFADTRQFSIGQSGLPTARHSMGLTNAVFYENGRFRWDESAATLEEQCLIPIEAEDEMGLPLSLLRHRLEDTSFYETLFIDAFGDAEVTDDRIAKALAQFIRSMVSYNSKYDLAYAVPAPDGLPDFAAVFDDSELVGQVLFERTPKSVNCHQCHRSPAVFGDEARNIGLDAKITDAGAGDGRFKVPSLRNIGVRGRFMHDGRFTSLMEVVEFYDNGIQESPFVDDILRIDDNPENEIERLNLSAAQKQALVDFMNTLTDQQFLNDPKFSDPFGQQVLFGDVDLDGAVLLLDVFPFVQRLTKGPYQNEADINQDGVVNLQDVSRFVDLLISN